MIYSLVFTYFLTCFLSAPLSRGAREIAAFVTLHLQFSEEGWLGAQEVLRRYLWRGEASKEVRRGKEPRRGQQGEAHAYDSRGRTQSGASRPTGPTWTFAPEVVEGRD